MALLDHISRIIDSLSWVSKLVELSPSNVHGMRLSGVVGALSCLVCWRIPHLVVVATCLRPTLYVILNLLLLLFVRIAYLNTLTDLSLLRSVKRIQSGSFSSVLLWRALLVVWSVIDIWIVYSVSWIPFGRAWSWPTLGCNSSLASLSSWIIFVRNLILSWYVSLILLLQKHLLLDLLFMELLTWS